MEQNGVPATGGRIASPGASVRARLGVLAVFASLLGAAVRFAGAGAAPDAAAEIRRYREAMATLRTVLANGDDLFGEADRADLRNKLDHLSYAVGYWDAARDPGPLFLRRAQWDCAEALLRATGVLDASSLTERVAAGAAPRWVARRWPLGRGLLVVRLSRADVPPGGDPAFASAEVDLARGIAAGVPVPAAPVAYAAVSFANVPAGTTNVPVRLLDAGREVARLDLALEVPPAGELKISLADAATGRPTAAVAGVYAPGGRLIVPANALRFDDGGFSYAPGQVRGYGQAHYWPGAPSEQRVFFVRGGFELRLPPGQYRVIAGKGTEYTPVVRTVTIRAGGTLTESLPLKRWIDMPARGWYSGDGHVHYARASRDANARLLLWTEAEDVHVANVLRMGDALGTYFEQYGFGEQGRVVDGDYALVPGQEDPRTNVIGHTLQLHLKQPVRFPDRYYLFGLVFDAVHAQGGLSGYAHMYQPDAMGFWVRRDMSLDVPRGKVDFVEMCEFGELSESTYYEFLNLGFPLTASAGSDVPWGNTIGDSRVYVYTGPRFDPDAWYAGLRAGHTFVTTGPMLEFTVNGQVPGSVIPAKAGDVLRIQARAEGGMVPPRYLEVLSNGEVLRSASGDRTAALEFTVPVRRSMWIAARCAGAHTTPVYVKVGNQPFWSPGQVPALVERRLEQLRSIEDLIRSGIPQEHTGNFDNNAALQASAPELQERLGEVRKIYADMIARAR